MTYIITGKADLLNRLKDELVKHGYTKLLTRNYGFEFLAVMNNRKRFQFTDKSAVGDSILTEITPSNYTETLNKILNDE